MIVNDWVNMVFKHFSWMYLKEGKKEQYADEREKIHAYFHFVVNILIVECLVLE